MIKVICMPMPDTSGFADDSSDVMVLGAEHVGGKVWREISVTPEQAQQAVDTCPEPNRWFILEE